MPIDGLAARSFFDNSVYPMVVIENDNFVYCNQAAINFLGGSGKEEIVGRQLCDFSPKLQPCGSASQDKARQMIELAERRGSHQFDWEYSRKDGSSVLAEVSLAVAREAGRVKIHAIWRDLSRRQRRDTEIRESEERFRQIFETNPDPVILIEPRDGIILDVNEAFESAIGIPRLAALGHNSKDLGIWVEPGLRDAFRAQLQQTGVVNNFEAKFRAQSGLIKTGLMSARVIKIGSAPFGLIVIRDITLEKAAEQALVEMNKMKSEFISTAAHELRTPITGIMGYTELLSDRELSRTFDEQQKQDFRREISSNCERLSRIVDEILDVSRIESGQRLPLDRTPVSVSPLLDRVVCHFSLKTKRQITVKFETGAPEILEADEHRLRQVLDNLLSNAIKYSPKEYGIEVTVAPLGSACRIGAIDQGKGMTPDQLEHIFEKFYRADRSDTAVGGLGLGMSIVKQIIEDHDGKIWVESNYGHGTKFFFTIPVGLNPSC